jgi:hypothetical protein
MTGHKGGMLGFNLRHVFFDPLHLSSRRGGNSNGGQKQGEQNQDQNHSGGVAGQR